jgi:hypothetical protein
MAADRASALALVVAVDTVAVDGAITAVGKFKKSPQQCGLFSLLNSIAELIALFLILRVVDSSHGAFNCALL